nr:MAG TPA: hypothetical protein [Caudoviricetes sp.]
MCFSSRALHPVLFCIRPPVSPPLESRKGALKRHTYTGTENFY